MATDYDYLTVSNGSGDAAFMHIEADRLAGITTITVDSVVNVPAKFIGTYGTLLPSGLIDPDTKVDFKGHVSAGTLVIDAFEPGSTDDGNTSGQVVTIKPNTGWANRVSAFINTDVINKIYPIGCIYTETTGTNPIAAFGVGTWVAFGSGRVLVGNGTSDATYTAGATGGESTHQLTTAEIPAHHHSNQYSTGAANLAIGRQGDGGGVISGNTGDTGGGGAHNNLQPYIVVYFWHRTA